MMHMHTLLLALVNPHFPKPNVVKLITVIFCESPTLPTTKIVYEIIEWFLRGAWAD